MADAALDVGDIDDDLPPPLEAAPRPARVVDPPPPLDPDPSQPSKTRSADPGARTRAGDSAAPSGAPKAAGLKKGFLNGGGAPRRRAAKAAPTPAPDVIRPKGPTPQGASARLAGLRLDEVQEALKEAGPKLAQGTGWLDDGFLARLQRDPVLMKGMANPRFAQAMDEVQRDPQGAMARHQGDAELQEFLARFTRFMGGHFSELAEKQERKGEAGPVISGRAQAAELEEPLLTPVGTKGGNGKPATPADDAAERLAQEALADPSLRAILEDKEVQKVLFHVQTGNTGPVEPLMRRPDMVGKLRRLAQAGLIQMRWER